MEEQTLGRGGVRTSLEKMVWPLKCSLVYPDKSGLELQVGSRQAISIWWCGRALEIQLPARADGLQSMQVLVMKLAQGTTSLPPQAIV